MPSRELQQLQQLQRVKAFAGAKVMFMFATKPQCSMFKYRDKAAMVNFPRACLFMSMRLPLREYAPAISHHGGRVTAVTCVTVVTCDLKVF